MPHEPPPADRDRIWTRLTRSLAVVALVLAILFVIIEVPRQQARLDLQLGYIQPEDAPQQVNAYRRLVLQVIGGLVVAAGLYLTLRRIQATERRADAATDQVAASMKQVAAMEEGQITERFTQAIEQLGSERLQIRLGAIYALERIAKDSGDDHPVVLKVLCAFLREESRKPLPSKGAARVGEREASQPRADMRAAAEVIGRLSRHWSPLGFNSDSPEGKERLDLSKADLRGAYLRKADLSHTNLREANLRGAYLRKTNLRLTNLSRANLNGANLSGTLLTVANLAEADLRDADLRGAHLVTADLSGACLTEAALHGAKLTLASLRNANLTEANLRGADLQADFTGTNLSGAKFTEANLSFADLSEANMHKSKLRLAEGLTVDRLCTARDLSGATLPDDLEAAVCEQCPHLLGEEVRERCGEEADGAA